MFSRPRGGPDRIELGIVDREPRSVRLSRRHAEVLEDLQADRAVLDVLLELCRGLRAPAGAPTPSKSTLANTAEPILVRALADEVDALLRAARRCRRSGCRARACSARPSP